MIKTLHFQCWGCSFNPWLESGDLTCFTAKKPKHKAEAIVTISIKTFKMVHIKREKKKFLISSWREYVSWVKVREGDVLRDFGCVAKKLHGIGEVVGELTLATPTSRSSHKNGVR